MKHLPTWFFCLVAGVLVAGCAKSVEPDAGTKQEGEEVTKSAGAEQAPTTSEGQTADSVAKAEFAVGKPAPAFAVKDTKGEDLELADYLGKVVVLDYWALW